MLRKDGMYTEEDLLDMLTQAGDLYGQLENALKSAVRAAKEGSRENVDICVRKADRLLVRLGELGAQERSRTGRPRASVSENGDRTLGQIRNSMRLCVPAGTLAREMGISESTFRRRMRKTEHLPDDVLFSRIP
jgi:hypothetical protein